MERGEYGRASRPDVCLSERVFRSTLPRRTLLYSSDVEKEEAAQELVETQGFGFDRSALWIGGGRRAPEFYHLGADPLTGAQRMITGKAGEQEFTVTSLGSHNR